MKLKSQLSASIATQLGSLQGTLEAKARSKILEYLREYSQSCPTVIEFQSIIQTLNNIQGITNQVVKRVNTFQKLAVRLDSTISTVNTLVNILRILPVPTAILGVGVPIGVTNSYAEFLVDSAELLEDLKNEQRAIRTITGSAGSQINNINNLLNRLLNILQRCAVENPELLPFLQQLQRDTGAILNELGPNKSFRASNGRDYFFEIIEEKELIGPVPRRIAIAKDNTGVTVLRGAPSFSSSTKVLIDELKLRIENQLP